MTLLEAMMAVGMLLAIVVAVTSAVTAGQQHAYEAHQRIAGSLAAEELMGRLVATPYEELLPWHGYTEAVGAMTDAQGFDMPDSYSMIGRDVSVITEVKELGGDVGVNVKGRSVEVRSFNGDGEDLTILVHFVPEPGGDG